MRKFLKVVIVLAILGVLLAGCLSDTARGYLRSLFDSVRSEVGGAVDSIKSEVEDVFESREEELANEEASSQADEAKTTLAALSRYFPDGSYFTVDASPCVHTEGGTVCADGTCRYEAVVQALSSEVWWSKVCTSGSWDCAVPDAIGSESFARFLYHAIRGSELAADAEPLKTYEISDLASVSDMAGSLKTGDLIHFTGSNEHWAIFLEANGVNIYLYEANLDGCEGISYNRATAYESLVSRFAGGTVEIYRLKSERKIHGKPHLRLNERPAFFGGALVFC